MFKINSYRDKPKIGHWFTFIIPALFVAIVGYLVIKSDKLNLPGRSIKNLDDKIVYLKEGNIYVFDVNIQEKRELIGGGSVLDFDVQKDKVIYLTNKDSLYHINIQNIKTGNSQLFISEPYILTPRFLASGGIIFVKRDKFGVSLDDGKIVSVDSLTKQQKILFIPGEISSLQEDEYCTTEEEKSSPKIGIYKTSPIIDTIFYFVKDWGYGCSGLVDIPLIEDTKAHEFLSEKFNQRNIFTVTIEDIFGWFGGKDMIQEVGWIIKDIFWMKDGSFFVYNIAPQPVNGYSVYYFDFAQNKKWAILDLIKTPELDILALKNAWLNSANNKFNLVFEDNAEQPELKLIKDIGLGDSNLKFDKIDSGNRFIDVNFLESGKEVLYISYVKQAGERYYLFVYNVSNDQTVEIDSSNKLIEI